MCARSDASACPAGCCMFPQPPSHPATQPRLIVCGIDPPYFEWGGVGAWGWRERVYACARRRSGGQGAWVCSSLRMPAHKTRVSKCRWCCHSKLLLRSARCRAVACCHFLFCLRHLPATAAATGVQHVYSSGHRLHSKAQSSGHDSCSSTCSAPTCKVQTSERINAHTQLCIQQR